MKFKVCFVIFLLETWHTYSDFGWLGIRYLISELKKDQDVEISVNFIESKEWEKQTNCIMQQNPDVVAMPALQQNLEKLSTVSKKIRSLSHSVKLVAGNTEATIRSAVLMEQIPELDFLVIGEGEYTFRELITALKENASFEQCMGIYYRTQDGIKKTHPRPLEQDIDRFSFPDREILPNYSEKNVYDIITSRGCMGNCTFCSNKIFEYQPGSKVRVRSLNNIINEIKMLVAHYNASYISFSDDTFGDETISAGFGLEDYYNALIKEKINIRYRIQLRCETINESNVKTLQKMLSYGLDNIFIGLESGNADDLKIYGKIANLDHNIQSIELLNKYHIPYSIGFIMFNPYSTIKRLLDNISLIKKCSSILTPYTLCSKLILFNGTSLLVKVKRDGLILHDDPLTPEYPYQFLHPEIEGVYNYFYRLTQLPVNFVMLDIINSRIKNMKANEHPLLHSNKINEKINFFYTDLNKMKNLLLSYCETVLKNYGKKSLNEKIEKIYQVLNMNVEKINDIVNEFIKFG